MVVIFAILALHILFFIQAKILIHDSKVRFKDIAYIVLTCALLLGVNIALELLNASVVAILLSYEFALFGVLFFYLFGVKAYSAKKAIILTSITMLIFSVSGHIIDAIIVLVLSAVHGEAAAAQLHTSIIAFRLLVAYATTIPLTLLFVRLTKDLRKAINQNERIQRALLGIVLFLTISFQITAIWLEFLVGEEHVAQIISMHAFFIAAYAVIAVVSFILFSKSMEARYALQRKEAEERDLQYYTGEIERQNTAVRKFKHDYQNILFSMDSYFEEKDFAGLEAYYTSRIKAASEVITKEDFSLENLNKIHVREIKSILAGKLMLTQSKDIDAAFEADREIDDFYVDSVSLVRIIGILMDNAVEALSELPGGKLSVGCFKGESGITLIVQNTCRQDIPKLHQLLREGFSTKGDGRGLGLSNLQEIVDAHANLTLETTIVEGNFVQTLHIGGV